MAKQCELCELPARMHCESDRASLCWECDARVHGANFLVARHSRYLLCRSCQAPTPWQASGARLVPTDSLCETCLGTGGCDVLEKRERGGGGGFRRGGEEEDEEDDEDDDEDDEDGENQVVPLSMEAATTATATATVVTPPPVASCSSSEESSSRGRTAVCQDLVKRMRGNADPSSSRRQDEGGRPPPQRGHRNPPTQSPAASPSSGHMRLEAEVGATRALRVGSPGRPHRIPRPGGRSPTC